MVPSVEKGSGFFDLPYLTSRRACAGHSWTATLTKTAPATVSRNSDAMRIVVPIDISGHAGINGSIASVLSLEGKSFTATVKPTVDIKMAVANDWCPQISVTPTQDGVMSATVEMVGRSCIGLDLGPFGHPEICAGPVNVDLRDKASEALNSQEGAIKSAAANAIDCAQVRNTVQTHWRPIVLPVSAAGSSTLFLNIVPQSLAMSTIQPTDIGLQVAVRAGVLAQLEAQAASTDALPLPPLGALVADSSGLRVVVRATTPYATLRDALEQSIVGQTFTRPSPAGDVSVTPEEVDVYPSNGKLALGIKIAAKLPGNMLDTNGWVYVTGTPIVAENGSAIELGNLSYSAVIDNELGQTLIVLFDEQILEQLKKASRIDLQPSMAKSSEDLMTQINAAKVSGIGIVADPPTTKLLDVAVDADALVATASADMNFTVTVIDDTAPLAAQ